MDFFFIVLYGAFSWVMKYLAFIFNAMLESMVQVNLLMVVVVAVGGS